MNSFLHSVPIGQLVDIRRQKCVKLYKISFVVLNKGNLIFIVQRQYQATY